jgi:hypothetical protein
MYKNLINIGLEEYLNSYFFNETWIRDGCIENIDNYVGSLSEAQKKILSKKFTNQNDFTRANDLFYELLIAYTYHQNGQFQEGSPDIIDDSINIEVKNINTIKEELERIQNLTPNSVRTGPLPEESNIEDRFKERFERHFKKAKSQINSKGKVYLIWDTTLSDFSENKEKIESILNNLCNEEMKKYPDIEIIHIFFGDLKKKVDSTVLEKGHF